MGALKRKLAVGGALLLALFVLGCVGAYFLVRSEAVRARIQAELSQRTGYDVRFDALRLTPGLSFVFSGVSAAKDGRVLFRGQKIAVFFLPQDLFHRRVHRLSLEKPRFHLALQDLFGSTQKTAVPLSIGALNVDDGEIVLDVGSDAPFALSAVSLSADNVDLGGIAGLQLRAYLPWLEGTAALSITGDGVETQVKILVEQKDEKPGAGGLPELPEEKAALAARFRIKASGGAYQVKGSGRASQLRWGSDYFTGTFDSQLDFDAQGEQLLFSLGVDMPRLPLKLMPPAIPIDPGAVKATLKGDYAPARRHLTVRDVHLASGLGALAGAGAVALGEEPAEVSATVRLRELALEALKPLMPEPLGDFAYGGKLAADFSLSGAYDNPVATGLAWSDAAKVQGKKASLSQLSVKVPFRWTRSALQVKGARMQAKGLSFGAEGSTQAHVGEVTVAGDVSREAGRPLQASANLRVVDGSFSTADGSGMGERLNLTGRFSYRDGDGNASFDGQARVERFELLWGKFFGDFRDREPALEVAGSYRPEDDELTLERFRIALDSVGRLELKGRLRKVTARPEFNLEIRTDDLRAGGFYDFFVRDTFKIAHPVLGRIQVAGKSGAALRAEGSLKAFTVQGNLRLEQGEVRETSGQWRVGAVALELPLKLRFPEAFEAEPAQAAPAGKLVIGEVRTESAAVPEIRAAVSLWNNRLRLPAPVRVSLFGGHGVIEGLAWKDVIGAPADFTFSLGLNSLRLGELTKALGWHRFGGTLTGAIPSVHWAGDALRSSGTITLDMFGGRVTIQGLEVEKPLSPLQAIRVDVKLGELDLEQVSETFEFGKISGVLGGTIRDLVIAQGQPAQFEADIRSVDKRGASQWISVEALNKITVLSSGNEAGALYGGLAGLFSSFRYSKLGFKAALKNDTLTLRGIESKGGTEYLVVGSLLPPTVNIISHTQEIGFSELLRRLERINKDRDSAS